MLVAGEADQKEPRQGAPTPETGPGRPGLFPSLETGLALAGTVGLVYVIGGAVMWLRFRHAHLPADQAVALLPKTDLLVAGLRVMILPALLSATFLVALACWQNARVARLERQREEGRAKLATLPADSREGAKLDARLRRLAQREHRLLPQRASRRRRMVIAASAVTALVCALIVPFSPGAFVWPAMLLAIVVYWQRLWSSSRSEDEPRPKPSLLHIAAVAVIASVLVSIARQVDPMTQLPSVTVTLAPNAGGSTPPQVNGVLVTATDTVVAVGDPREHSIRTYPRSRVTAISVQPPLAPQTPPRSLISRLLFRDAWAWTPLKVWCEGDAYGWTRLGSACQARPHVAAGALTVAGGSVRGLKLVCPKQAATACRGFVFIDTTVARYDPGSGTVRPDVLIQKPFDVLPGRSAKIALPLDPRWETTLFRRRDSDVRVRVRLTRDALGKERMFEDAAARTLSIAHAVAKEEKKADARQAPRRSGRPGSPGPANPPDDQNGDAGADDRKPPEPTPSPEPTPTPEPNPLVPPPSGDEVAPPPTPTPTPTP